MVKNFFKLVGLAFVVFVAGYLWQVVFNYRFEAIAPGKVYKSAAMPPDKIDSYLDKYHIKTVIDLRRPGEHHVSGYTTSDEIKAEAIEVAKVPGARHISIPSGQVPTAETLKKFFAVMDNKDAYPVLIHCHDGMGRAVIYSAIYRIEYQHWSDAAARNKTRPVVKFLWYHSAFADGSPKGNFLMHYKPRSDGRESTYYQLTEASAPAAAATPASPVAVTPASRSAPAAVVAH